MAGIYRQFGYQMVVVEKGVNRADIARRVCADFMFVLWRAQAVEQCLDAVVDIRPCHADDFRVHHLDIQFRNQFQIRRYNRVPVDAADMARGNGAFGGAGHHELGHVVPGLMLDQSFQLRVKLHANVRNMLGTFLWVD